jgi:short-subunit dehydrogenase
VTANHMAPSKVDSPLSVGCLVITGASSGLGRDLALGYAAPGVSLGLTGRDAGRLEAVACACRDKGAVTTTAVIDVADAAAMAAFLSEFDKARPIDLLIANAGICGGPPDEQSIDGLALAAGIVSTNLLGVVHAVEAIAPAMIARGRGQIAVIASTSAYRGLPYMPAYAASKAGVRVYGEGLRARLAPLGVAVSVVVPSFFESPMTHGFHGEKPLMVSASAAAARVRRGLDRGQPRIVFPLRIALLVQILDLIPARIGDALLRHGVVRIDKPTVGARPEIEA